MFFFHRHVDFKGFLQFGRSNSESLSRCTVLEISSDWTLWSRPLGPRICHVLPALGIFPFPSPCRARSLCCLPFLCLSLGTTLMGVCLLVCFEKGSHYSLGYSGIQYGLLLVNHTVSFPGFPSLRICFYLLNLFFSSL